MKKFKGKGYASRSDNNSVTMHFQAENGMQVMEAKFTLKEFARFITSMWTDIEELQLSDVYADAHKVHQSKIEMVPRAKFSKYNLSKEEYYKKERKHLKKFEVDGWHARVGDLDNPHNCVGDNVKVVFFRYVEPEVSGKESSDETTES